MICWKKNLFFIWMSQFLAITGFAFSMPFHAYYIQNELGVTDPTMLKLYVALFGAAAPLSLAIFAPIWGAAADRFGRRMMMLRAYVGAAFFLYIMGMTDSVIVFICIRLLQGVLTGTMTAAQALVAVQTPEKHSGFALGTLNSGVYAGAMAGMALGGICADQFGYRNTFAISSVILIIATLLVLFGTREKFVKPERSDRTLETHMSFSVLKSLFPVLALIGIASFARRFDMTMFPLLVQDVHGSTIGAATQFGLIMAPAAVAGALSGVFLGYMADRLRPARILSIAAVIAGVFLFFMGRSESLVSLFITRFAVSFCIGGFAPVLQSWVSDLTHESGRGRLFGWITTAQASGWIFAPLTSSVVAIAIDVRSVFTVGSLVFLLLAVAVVMVAKKLKPDISDDA